MPYRLSLKNLSLMILLLTGVLVAYFTVTWVAKPTVLHTYFVSDKAEDLEPSIAYGNGKWVVLWTSNETIRVSTSSDTYGWSKPADLYVDKKKNISALGTAPQVATDGNNNWLVVWVSSLDLDGIGNDYDLLEVKSDDNAKSWQAIGPVNGFAKVDQNHGSYTVDDKPRIATDGSHWMVAWEGNSWAKTTESVHCEGTVGWKPSYYRGYVQHRDSLKAKWKQTVCIQILADKEFRTPAVAADAQGNWVVPFSTDKDPEKFFAPYPCIATSTGKDKEIGVVRTDNKKVASSNVWGTCYPWYINSYATKDNDEDLSPSIATNGTVWIAAWRSRKGIGSDSDIYVSISKDTGQTWGPAIPIIKSQNAINLAPAIATTGGEWVVVWSSTENLNNAIGNDYDILIATSKDNGQSWSKPKPLHKNATSDKGNDQSPQIATDGKWWAVVWASNEDSGTGADSDILIARFESPVP